MDRGERWSRDRGSRWLTLSVFAENTHAWEVYERRGYGPDIFRYLKVLE